MVRWRELIPPPWWQPPGHPYEALFTTGSPQQPEFGRRRRSVRRAAALGGVLLCLVGLWTWRSSPLYGVDEVQGRQQQLQGLGGGGSRSGELRITERESGDGTVMKVLVTNKYRREEGKIGEMYPWQHVAEPWKETRMEILSWPGEGDNWAGLGFTWYVEGQVAGTGAAISTVFKSPGAYECSVSAFLPRSDEAEGEHEHEHDHAYVPGHGTDAERWEDAQGAEATETAQRTPGTRHSRYGGRAHANAAAAAAAAESTAAATADASTDAAAEHRNRLVFTVVVKYVRREIRRLTDRDRETFFNAISIMQRVPSAVGQAIYGSKYYSKDYFNRIHLYYGGHQDCDHWHGGAGFVTSHIALSLMFEQSLQAVDPSIALPYWDFTIEGTTYDWSNFRQSPLFSDDWFGEAAPRNAMRTPDRGRFGYIPVMMNATEYSDLHNSYGVLRPPWNNDPTPFVTRSDYLMGFKNHRKPSGCRKYRDAMREQSWMALTVAFNAGAHGEIHELLGGAWSRGLTAYAERTSPIVQPFVHMAVALMKMLWRAGYMVCPESCAFDLPWEECACTCSEAAFGDQGPRKVLEDAGVLAAGIFYDENFVLIEALVDDEGHAYDVLPGYTKHETDRIYDTMLRTLCIPMRVGSHYGATSTNDMSFWLIHPTFDRLWHLKRLEPSTTLGDENWVGNNSCYGHNPDNVQPFHNLFLGDGDVVEQQEDGRDRSEHVKPAKVYYTNKDLYELLNPHIMDGPYMYDNFEWPHCDAQGVFIHGK